MPDANPASRTAPSARAQHPSPPDLIQPPHFQRALSLFPAIAINMTQMCGIGPFITIPPMVAAMGGPQAMLGWLVGAILAIADGFVWAELGASMPGSGGTYVYLREAFQYRTGQLMPFLFVWTAVIYIPLIMSTGVIGLVQYLGYYFPFLAGTPPIASRDWLIIHFISVAVTAITFWALYRNINAIARLTNFLWCIMILSVGGVILAAFTHFHPSLAFAFPPGAFHLDRKFFAGLGAGLLIAIYDYLGYNTTAYMGDELRDPSRVLPRSIIWSILGMMVIYLAMNIGVMGVLPWRDVAQSTSVGSAVFEKTWGKFAAQFFTALIILTAFASVFTGLLGSSRVPFNAARDRVFLPLFSRMHPTLNFPHVSLIVMCVITAIGTLFDLTFVINMLVALMVLVQCIGQVFALITLRKRQPGLRRPYRMFAYPIPAVFALVGWLYVYYSSGWTTICWSICLLAAGIVVYLLWARTDLAWPFAAPRVREEFLQAQNAGANQFPT